MPEYFTLTSTKMKRRAAAASAIWFRDFGVFKPTSLLQKPVSQVEKNNLSRMMLALGNKTAFIIGGLEAGGKVQGCVPGSCVLPSGPLSWPLTTLPGNLI